VLTGIANQFAETGKKAEQRAQSKETPGDGAAVAAICRRGPRRRASFGP